MDEKKKIELTEVQLDEVTGGCDDHDPNYYAVIPEDKIGEMPW